jgi:outer membrane lipoprotein LolB
MTRRSATVAAIVFGALAAGCATLPPGSDNMNFAQRRDHLTQIDTWELRGRIAVDTGEQAFQGRFQWSQHPEHLALSVRGPLGTNVLRVSGPPPGQVHLSFPPDVPENPNK